MDYNISNFFILIIFWIIIYDFLNTFIYLFVFHAMLSLNTIFMAQTGLNLL